MPVPAELQTSLPASIDPGAVRVAVRAAGSPASHGGETWLLDLDGSLAVVYRSSIFDTLEPLALVESGEPVVLRDDAQIEIHRADGPPFEVRSSLLEHDAVRALLAKVGGVARNRDMGPAKAEPGLAEVLADASASGSRSAKQITLADLDVIDPDGELDVCAAFKSGDLHQAKLAAHKLAAQTTGREHDEWNDFIAVLELMEAGDHVAAGLWTQAVRRIPATVHDAVFADLSAKLEADDEPALAWAAAGKLADEDCVSARRGQLEAELGRDALALTRVCASRSQTFFASAAAAGDHLAQRGLAHACLDADEPNAALTWIRLATADRFDFAARMLEVQILRVLAAETGDDSELLEALHGATRDFGDRPEPFVELAVQVEFDDPVLAMDCLRQALDLEFDEFVFMDLIELLEANGRYMEMIGELQAVLADADAVSVLKAELRAKLALAEAQRGKGSNEVRVGRRQKPSRVAAFMVILAIVIALWWIFGE